MQHQTKYLGSRSMIRYQNTIRKNHIKKKIGKEMQQAKRNNKQRETMRRRNNE